MNSVQIRKRSRSTSEHIAHSQDQSDVQLTARNSLETDNPDDALLNFIHSTDHLFRSEVARRGHNNIKCIKS